MRRLFDLVLGTFFVLLGLLASSGLLIGIIRFDRRFSWLETTNVLCIFFIGTYMLFFSPWVFKSSPWVRLVCAVGSSIVLGGAIEWLMVRLTLPHENAAALIGLTPIAGALAVERLVEAIAIRPGR